MRVTDRGVSDMVAFILVFSLIITSVGITYTYGYTTLTDYQENEQTRNAERAFVVLSDNIGEIESSHVEARTGELRLAGGTLSVENGTSIAVNATTGTGPDPYEVMDPRTIGSLTYDYEGTTIEYENGAVFRQDGDGRYIMLTEPRYQCGESYAVVSVVELIPVTDGSLSSEGTVQIRSELNTARLRYPVNRTGGNNTAVDNVTVTVDSDKDEAWKEYFEDTGWEEGATTADGTEYTCEASTGDIDLYVRQTRINVEYFT